MAIRELEQRLAQLREELDNAESEVSYWRSQVCSLEEDIRRDELELAIYNRQSPEQRAREEAEAEEEARLEAERERQDKLLRRRYRTELPQSIADYWLR